MKFTKLAKQILKEFQEPSKRIPCSSKLEGEVRHSCELEIPKNKFPQVVIHKYDEKYGNDSENVYMVVEYSIKPNYSDGSFDYEYGSERGTHHQHSWEFELTDWKLSTPEEDEIFSFSEQEDQVDSVIQSYIENNIERDSDKLTQKAETGSDV